MRKGVQVTNCRASLRAWKFLRKYIRHLAYDAVIVGEYANLFVPFGKILSTLTRAKFFAFNPFISLYDTKVFDRKQVRPQSLSAAYYFSLDAIPCKMADICIMDTEAHGRYFSETFNVPISKFRRVFVGADDDIFQPRRRAERKKHFLVHFHGSFIPLQGVEYVVKAAKLLEREEEIRFQIVGGGQTFDAVRKLGKDLEVRNVTFLPWVPYHRLPDYIASADLCLGIFGGTDKAMRVIPNKVFQALAMKKPVITAASPAIGEAFDSGQHLLTCRPANAEAIAEEVLRLKKNQPLRERVARAGYLAFKEKFSPGPIGASVLRIIQEFT